MQLLLMPGMDGTGELFAPLLGALSTSVSARVISYPRHEPLGYAALLPIVRAALPMEPFVLVGESFSGPLALMVAAERPVGLRGVVLCASFVKNPVWWAPSVLRHAVRGAAFRVFPAFAQTRALLGRHGTPALCELLAKANAGVSPAVLAMRARSILTIDVVEELRACPVPILYIRGADDGVVTIRSLRRIQAVVPAVEVVTVPAPHLVLQCQPEASAAAILAFARSVGGGDP